MRSSFALAVVALLPSFSFAQTEKIVEAIEQKLAAIRYVQSLQDKESGAFKTSADAKGTSLRATSAAIRALKYLHGKPAKLVVPHPATTGAFILLCYDPKTGGFADSPGGKPDVALTAVGVMAAVELEIPKEKFAKAMDYLKENAKTFEDVRIGAAAVEAWGVKDCPFDLKLWFQIAGDFHRSEYSFHKPRPDPKDGGARILGSTSAMSVRLGQEFRPAVMTRFGEYLRDGQRDDGSWGKKDEKASDLETTYRVMRALYLLKAKPDHPPKLREFIGKCRNKDGGYGVKPGEPSSVSGVYFATIIAKWLDELEKK